MPTDSGWRVKYLERPKRLKCAPQNKYLKYVNLPPNEHDKTVNVRQQIQKMFVPQNKCIKYFNPPQKKYVKYDVRILYIYICIYIHI